MTSADITAICAGAVAVLGAVTALVVALKAKSSAAGQQANVTPEFMLELEKKMAADLGLSGPGLPRKNEQPSQPARGPPGAGTRRAQHALGAPAVMVVRAEVMPAPAPGFFHALLLTARRQDAPGEHRN